MQDTADSNPLVRALAIRTMGCLRAEKIIDYLCDPLQKCLRDEDPYVRKTAALAVAKLYDLKPELAVDNGFVEQLKDMIGDSNPMVRRSLIPLQHATRCRPKRQTADNARFLPGRRERRPCSLGHSRELNPEPRRPGRLVLLGLALADVVIGASELYH